MRQLGRVDLPILDDWGPKPLLAEQQRDLLEIVEDRYNAGSLIITSQIPVDRWYELVGNPTLLVDRARFAEKQDERADDQHGEHQNLELIDDCDDGRLASDHVVERGEPRPGD